jgi:hypothetical protein
LLGLLSYWKNKSGKAEQIVTIAAQTLFGGDYALFKPLKLTISFPKGCLVLLDSVPAALYKQHRSLMRRQE